MEQWKIEISGLRYSSRRFDLHPLSFKAKPGTITGIIGKNGSGKSTLLRLIHGDVKGGSGKILLDGRMVESYRPFELSRKISILYQEIYEPFSFTVRDIMNVAGYSREANVISYMSILEELGIADLADVQFTNLSGGERRLVTIAATIYQDSEIMLLDEPTTYLDIDNQLIVIDMLRSLKEKDKTIVVVMHDVNAVQALCDELIMLKSGQTVASGATEAVMNEENLKRTFDVQFTEISLGPDRIFLHRSNGKQ